MVISMFESIDFHLLKKSINKKSKLEYKAGASLKSLDRLQRLQSGYIVTNGFDEFFIGDIESYSWTNGVENRNWWWQVQSLSPLSDFVDSFGCKGDQYFKLSVEVFLGWCNGASNNKDSPLAWHDHGSAFRLRNIVKWFMFCIAEGLFEKIEDELKDKISLEICRHVQWLLKEENYSIYTNHGFDQALILYRISILLMCPPFSDSVLSESKKRLLGEIDFAFTSEGVHKENSPGYQQFMISRLEEVARLSVLGDEEVSKYSDDTIIKAKKFLDVVTLFDGKLPVIGDTQARKSNSMKPRFSSKGKFDYTKSGYYIEKLDDRFGKEVYLLVKNTHLSNYHRHDDDLLVYLYVDGEVLLGDGGVLSHDEHNTDRKFLRSHWAHSVPYIPSSFAIRDNAILNKSNELFFCEKGNLVGESASFKCLIERKINLENLFSGSISIRDKAFDNNNISINWYFPTVPHKVTEKNNIRQFIFSNNILTLSLGGMVVDQKTCTGLGSEVSDMAISSQIFNEFDDAMRVSVDSGTSFFDWSLNFQPIKNLQNISDIKLGGAIGLIDYKGENGVVVKNKYNKPMYLSLYDEDVKMGSIDIDSEGFFVCNGCNLEFSVEYFGEEEGVKIFLLGYDENGDRCFTFRSLGNQLNIVSFPEEVCKYVFFVRVASNKLISLERIGWKWLLK